MALKSHGSIMDAIQSLLSDDGTLYTDDFLTLRIPEALPELSRYVPFIVKETLTTTADSKDLDISDIYHFHNILRIEALEYRVSKTPREFRNWKEHSSNVISMLIDFQPSADEDVYLYCAKIHKIPPLTTAAGAATAGYAAGVSTINVDGLVPATATIEADSTFTIASDSTGTRYRLTVDTVLSGGAGDLVFTPVLAEAIAENDVVTIDNSTLTQQLEPLLIDLVAAKAAISKATSYVNKINVGGGGPWQDIMNWGQTKLAFTLPELRRLRKRTAYEVYPRV